MKSLARDRPLVLGMRVLRYRANVILVYICFTLERAWKQQLSLEFQFAFCIHFLTRVDGKSSVAFSLYVNVGIQWTWYICGHTVDMVFL